MRSAGLKFAFVLVLSLALAALAAHGGGEVSMRASAAWREASVKLAALGPWAELIAFCLVFVVALVGFPPQPLVAALLGVALGSAKGTALAAGGSFFGAWVVYELARGPLGERLERRWPNELAKLKVFAWSGGKASLWVLRTVPLMSFPLVNWLSGLAKVPRRDYLLITFVARLPFLWLCATAGALGHETSLPQFAWYALALLASAPHGVLYLKERLFPKARCASEYRESA